MQVLRQGALGWQLLAGQELCVQNILPDAGVQLIIFWLPGSLQIVCQHLRLPLVFNFFRKAEKVPYGQHCAVIERNAPREMTENLMLVG